MGLLYINGKLILRRIYLCHTPLPLIEDGVCLKPGAKTGRYGIKNVGTALVLVSHLTPFHMKIVVFSPQYLST